MKHYSEIFSEDISLSFHICNVKKSEWLTLEVPSALVLYFFQKVSPMGITSDPGYNYHPKMDTFLSLTLVPLIECGTFLRSCSIHESPNWGRGKKLLLIKWFFSKFIYIRFDIVNKTGLSSLPSVAAMFHRSQSSRRGQSEEQCDSQHSVDVKVNSKDRGGRATKTKWTKGVGQKFKDQGWDIQVHFP